MITDEEINEIYTGIKQGLKVRVHRDYTSTVVSMLKDGDVILIVYKDWNKYKKRYDYHVDTAYSFCFKIALYKQSNYGKFGEGKERKTE